jgi:hypothetical protein
MEHEIMARRKSAKRLKVVRPAKAKSLRSRTTRRLKKIGSASETSALRRLPDPLPPRPLGNLLEDVADEIGE